MGAVSTARARARADITREIADAARRQLATDGASALSLRAVARELGMASSALYRYFSSRDELLTALIIAAYDGLGAAAERAQAKVPREDLAGRWFATARAVRRWAVKHPHEYALIYGSPVPGYRAPADTVVAATRVVLLLAGVVTDAAAAGALAPPPRPLDVEGLLTPSVFATAEAPATPPYPDLVLRTLTAWSALFGAISFELFGHLHNAVTDYPRYFDNAMAVVAETVGLQIGPPGD